MVRALAMPRLVAFAGLCSIAAINGRVGIIVSTVHTQSWANAVVGLLEVSAVVWFAIFAAWSIAQWDDADDRYRRGDGLVLTLLGLAILLPSPIAASLAGLGAAIWLFLTSASGSVGRRLAIILFAIAAQQVLSRVFLALFSEAILGADVVLVAFASGMESVGNVIIRDDGSQLIVAAGCSSVRNLSVAGLAWIVAVQFFKLPVCARLWAYVGASLAAVILLNTVRMLLMAWYPQHFEFLHGGGGAAMFGWGGFLVVILLAGIAILDLAPRKTQA